MVEEHTEELDDDYHSDIEEPRSEGEQVVETPSFPPAVSPPAEQSEECEETCNREFNACLDKHWVRHRFNGIKSLRQWAS